MNKVQRQWSDRKKIIEEPLFTSYVFVRLNESENSNVRMCDGVINFVYWLQKPAVVRNEEIETIKRFVNDYTDVKLEKKPINLNDKVRVIAGPLMQREGNIIEVRSRTVKVSLPSLGYVLVAEVANTNVEIISNYSPQYYAVRI